MCEGMIKRFLLLVLCFLIILISFQSASAEGVLVSGGCVAVKTGSFSCCDGTYWGGSDMFNCDISAPSNFCTAQNGCYYTTCNEWHCPLYDQTDCNSHTTNGVCAWDTGYWTCEDSNTEGTCTGGMYESSVYRCQGSGNCAFRTTQAACLGLTGNLGTETCDWRPTLLSCSGLSTRDSCRSNGCTWVAGHQCFKDGDGDGVTGGSRECISNIEFVVGGCPSGYENAEFSEGDCDDTTSLVYPGAVELCDGLDNDCDSQVDEESIGSTYYQDADGDGYSTNQELLTCLSNPGSGWLSTESNPRDCVDTDALVYPGAVEFCDGLDNDCDSQVDEGGVCGPTGCTDWYRDQDGDGYTVATPTTLCSGDTTTGYLGSRSSLLDCVDTDALVYPGAVEFCDGLDNDCDSQVDEGGVCGPTGCQSYYRDSDGDGWSTATSITLCDGDNTNGWTRPLSIPLDCDDDEVGIHPGAAEICWNGNRDEDCDGTYNNGCPSLNTWYIDYDGDGYGNPSCNTVSSASRPSLDHYQITHFVPGHACSDCSDYDPNVNPGAPDLCNGNTNDDCSLSTPDGSGESNYFQSTSCGTGSCQRNGRWECQFGSMVNTCSPTPAAPAEICGDGQDNECNGIIDDPLICTGDQSYFCDNDGDGYRGRGSSGVCSGVGCEPSGCSLIAGTDCNDANPLVYPSAVELCDGVDNDCDAQVDEGSIGSTYYQDADGDGYGAQGVSSVQACGPPSSAWKTSTQLNGNTNNDCADDNGNMYPGAVELCDGLDNDCDVPTQIDEGLSSPLANNQLGVCSGARKVCGGLAGWQEPNYFSYSPLYEGAVESSCDNQDNDCDGATDENLKTRYYADNDNDQWLDQYNFVDLCVDNPTDSFYGYSDRDEPATNGLWDQDDSEWNITYEACGVLTFIAEKNSYLGDYAGAVANDWAFDNMVKPISTFVFDKFRGACTPSENYCVVDSNLFDINGDVIPLGWTLDKSGAGYDETMYCGPLCDEFGCAWSDLDGSQLLCEAQGFIWAENGTANLGEYETTETECCGDDSSERSSVRSCLSSTSNASICCPNDGSDYYNLDGECVTSCPDLMNSQETFISLDADFYEGYSAALSDNPNAYCCDGSDSGVAAGGPLCVTGERGCFVSVGIPGTQDETKGRKYYCQEMLGDNYCMVETCLEGNTYQACEVFQHCSDSISSVSYDFADQKILYEDYSVITTQVEQGNYYTIDASCSPAQINDCEEVTRTECTPIGDCDVLCQRDEAGNVFNCQEVCSAYDCQLVTSYHGGECRIDPSCNPSLQTDETEVISTLSLSNPRAFGTCNQFGCAETACDPYGCPISQEYVQKDTTCSQDYYCTDLSCIGGVGDLRDENLRCFLETVDNGNPFVLNITESTSPVLTNTYFQCNSTPNYEEGDPWCEYLRSDDSGSSKYNSYSDMCRINSPFVCDWSPTSGGIIQSGSVNGCYDPLLSTDDYWGLYDSSCFAEGGSPKTNLYSQACCLAYSINDFDVYDADIDSHLVSDGIRIY